MNSKRITRVQKHGYHKFSGNGIGEEWLAKSKNHIKAVLQTVGQIIITSVQATAPVESGELRDSFRLEEDPSTKQAYTNGGGRTDHRISVLIRNTAPHAREVELDQPFLSPVLQSYETREMLKKKIEVALMEALTQHANPTFK